MGNSLVRWSGGWKLGQSRRGVAPTLEERDQRRLLEHCAVPVSLFMVAHPWKAAATRERATRAHVYQQFMLLTLRSKLEHDRGRHPIVGQAAEELKADLRESSLVHATSRLASFHRADLSGLI